MESDEVLVHISVDRLNELEDTERFMECLEAAGVDNWEGYDHARDMYQNG